MTPAQIKLARFALGLDGQRRQSYRNEFVAASGHYDYEDWLAMVASGNATRLDGKRLPFGGDDLFHLTYARAKLALRPGEHLDPEDFPS